MIRLINSSRSLSAGTIMEMRNQIEPVFGNWPCTVWAKMMMGSSLLRYDMHLTGVIMTVHCLI